MDWSSSKRNLHRAALATIALLLCIVFFYQSFNFSPSRSGAAASWLAPRLQQQEPASAIAGANDSAPAILKPSVQLLSANTSSSSSNSSSFPEEQPIQSTPREEIGSIPPAPTPNPPPFPSEIETVELRVEELQPNSSSSPSSLPGADSTTRVAQKQREIPEWRVKLEQNLQSAKQEIDGASSRTMQLDAQVTKSIYNNAHKFFKSYELMEKVFKVYMYGEGEPRLVHQGPLTGIYCSEGRFIHEMNQNSGGFVTGDPREAHMFFLPYSVAHMVLDLYVPGSRSMLPLATFIKNYVNLIAATHPFWNLTRGSDHFFVSCHDWGPATARDHPELRSNAIKVVCNADLTEEFIPNKDASLPETYLHSLKLPTKLGGPGPAKRPILAFFAGQMHGRVRPTLIEHWKDKDPDMRIYEVLPPEIAKKTSYTQHMKSSKFCICAMGFEVNSPRIVESIYYDCVPVIIADNFVLPFSDVLRWESFSVTVSEAEVPRLKEILLGVSEERYRKMQSRLRRVRPHFVWHDRAERFDMFYMIFHSVWLRRLQQIDRIRELEASLLPL